MSPTESQYQFLTILEEKSSQKMSNTQMGTTFSCPNKRLIIAISDDDPKNFAKLNFSMEDLANVRIEDDMNILNFAIDNERVEIIKYLGQLAKEYPEFG